MALLTLCDFQSCKSLMPQACTIHACRLTLEFLSLGVAENGLWDLQERNGFGKVWVASLKNVKWQFCKVKTSQLYKYCKKRKMMGAFLSLRNTENFSKCCEQFVQYLLKYNVIWRSHGLLHLYSSLHFQIMLPLLEVGEQNFMCMESVWGEVKATKDSEFLFVQSHPI